ncbi:glycosyltransferase family 9 protein [Geovibrio sp. ADMFC3]
MKHIFLLQAFGDNLVSLRLLKNFIGQDIRVHGTSLTEQIVEIVKVDEFKIEQIYDGIPAFYNLRKEPLLKSVKDFIFLIKYIKANIPSNEPVFFEKDDFRFKLMKLLLNRHILKAAKKEIGFYEDRAKVFESCLNTKIEFTSSKDFKLQGRSVVINPVGRNETRHLNKAILAFLVKSLKSSDFTISIIDHLGLYSEFESEVDNYYRKTSLKEAVNILKSADVYCGPDSLFIHLAYYYRKPYFCIMNYDSSYFLPPHSEFCSICISGDGMELLPSKFGAWLQDLEKKKVIS